MNIKENEKLSIMNHSCAHLLAQAVKHLYPNALFWVGPVIEDGFYYDIDLGDEVIKEEDDELVDQEWHVEKKNDTYYVTGAPIERLMSKVNIFDVESRQYMQRVLNKMGVMDKARELGLQDGEYLDIIGYQMEYND